MEIIIQKKNLAPIFENVITQKIKNNTKNQIIQSKKKKQNPNHITIVSREDRNKIVSIKKIIYKSILFLRFYDKILFLFLKKINFSPDGILKPKKKYIKEYKSKEKNKYKINKNINKAITKTTSFLSYVDLNEKKNKKLSEYGNGIFKILTPKNVTNVEGMKINKLKSKYLNILGNKNNIKNGNIKNEEKKEIEIKPNIKKYLKTISLFNSELASYQNIIYQFNKSKKISSTIINKNVFTLLEYSFLTMASLISKPVFVNTSSKVLIQIFFYLNKNKFIGQENKSKFLSLNKKKIHLLCSYISKLYKKPVELELNRLYYPFFDSNILSNMIGLISNIIKFRFIIKKLFFVAKLKKPKNLNSLAYSANNRYSLIPSFLSGIKIKLAGRLLTQRVKPRLTVKNIQKGTLSRGKANFVNTARFTNKNKRGAFSITVTLGHIFF